MLRLMLLRHAKSDTIAGMADIERPLTERGFRQAKRVGHYLREQHLLPEQVIVSCATRTQQTWQAILPAFDKPVAYATEDRIYEASVANIIAVIRGVIPGPRTLLLIGHNPGLALTTQYLCGQGEAEALGRLQMGFSPASLAVMDFDVDAWMDICEQGGRLIRFETPDTMDKE